MKSTDEIFEQLVVGFLSDRLSEEETEDLLNFLNSDNPFYQARYKELSDSYAKSLIPTFELQKEDNFSELSHRLHFSKPTTSVSIWKSFQKYAAILIFCLSTLTAIYYITNDALIKTYTALVDNELTVPLGSQIKMVLPDSTVVWLNSGSVLKYDNNFGKTSRNVELLGEAYFEVTKNKEMPFMVDANEIEVVVLGTIFNLRAYREDKTIEVNLIEGSVAVNDQRDKSRSQIMSENQQLTYNKLTEEMSVKVTEAYKSALWTTGKLSFVNTSLLDIIHSLERRYDVRINIESPDVGSEYFTGTINLDMPIEEVLNYIDVDGKYKWSQTGNMYSITNRY